MSSGGSSSSAQIAASASPTSRHSASRGSPRQIGTNATSGRRTCRKGSCTSSECSRRVRRGVLLERRGELEQAVGQAAVHRHVAQRRAPGVGGVEGGRRRRVPCGWGTGSRRRSRDREAARRPRRPRARSRRSPRGARWRRRRGSGRRPPPAGASARPSRGDPAALRRRSRRRRGPNRSRAASSPAASLRPPVPASSARIVAAPALRPGGHAGRVHGGDRGVGGGEDGRDLGDQRGRPARRPDREVLGLADARRAPSRGAARAGRSGAG